MTKRVKKDEKWRYKDLTDVDKRLIKISVAEHIVKS